MTITLAKNRVDLWLLPIDPNHSDKYSQTEITNTFSKRELVRYHKFKVAGKRDEFLASRILLRHLLTLYTNYSPAEIEAIPDEMGRPYWFSQTKKLTLYFSLSHTKGMVCCTVSNTERTGCDIEQVRPRKYERDLTRKVFSEKEQRFYQSLSTKEQREFFYKSWTLKEAFVKAIGKGLLIPFTSSSFSHMTKLKKWTPVEGKNLGEEGAGNCWYFYTAPAHPDYIFSTATIIAEPVMAIHQVALDGHSLTDPLSSNMASRQNVTAP